MRTDENCQIRVDVDFDDANVELNFGEVIIFRDDSQRTPVKFQCALVWWNGDGSEVFFFFSMWLARWVTENGVNVQWRDGFVFDGLVTGFVGWFCGLGVIDFQEIILYSMMPQNQPRSATKWKGWYCLCTKVSVDVMCGWVNKCNTWT